jgi:N-methylhydantoinase A/oxoprolinase/acetone carboxylase beta subunit
MMQQAQRENDLLAAATTQGFGVGQQDRQTDLQEQAYLRNEPLNTLSAVRTGAQVQGPAILEQADTTVWLEPGFDAKVDAMGNLLVTVQA